MLVVKVLWDEPEPVLELGLLVGGGGWAATDTAPMTVAVGVVLGVLVGPGLAALDSNPGPATMRD